MSVNRRVFWWGFLLAILLTTVILFLQSRLGIIKRSNEEMGPSSHFLPHQTLTNSLGMRCIEISYFGQQDHKDIFQVNYFPFEYIEAPHEGAVFHGHELIPTFVQFEVDVSGLHIINHSNPSSYYKSVYLSFHDTVVDHAVYNSTIHDTSIIQLFNRVKYFDSVYQCYRLYNYWRSGTNLLLYINSRRLIGVANECVTSDKESLIISCCGYIPDHYNHLYYPSMSLECPK